MTDPSQQAIQDGDKYAIEKFDIDIGRCMYCGLCVEGCPYDALFMGSGFERARDTRDELFIPMEELKNATKRPSTWFRPQLERQDFDPYAGASQEWYGVGREPFFWHPKRPAQQPENMDQRASADGDYESEH